MSGTSEEHFGGTHVTDADRFNCMRGEAMHMLIDIYYDIKYHDLPTSEHVDLGYLEELCSVLPRFVRNGTS